MQGYVNGKTDKAIHRMVFSNKKRQMDKLLIYLKDTVLSEIAILKGHIYVQLQLYGIFKNTKL